MAYKYEPHRPIKMRGKRLPWLICRDCSLIYLKNEATRKEIRKGHLKAE